MRARLLSVLGLLLVVAALLVAGCGGGDSKGSDTGGDAGAGNGSVPASAGYVPSTAPAFITADTDFEGDGWGALDDLSQKFPDRQKLLQQITAELTKEGLTFEGDIKPALGDETATGVLNFDGDSAVLLTQPDDEAKARALVGKLAEGDSPPVLASIGDWLAASDKQAAVDAAQAASDGDSLVDKPAFVEALEDLPGGALLRFWVDGAALTKQVNERAGESGATKGLGTLQSLAGSVEAQDDGVRMHTIVHRTGGPALASYSAQLVSEIPTGALLYLSFSGLDKALQPVRDNPALADEIAEAESELGVTLDELLPLLAKEGAIYLRPGAPIPEVTVVLQVDDEAAALATADKLAAKLGPSVGATGPPTATDISGVSVKKLTGPQFAIYFSTFDGKLVFTSSTSGITGLREGDKLDADADFKAARDGAGMPDETSGFAYFNLKQLVPLALNYATTAGATVPPDIEGNLEPLRSLLFYGAVDGDKLSVTGFLGVE